MKLVKFHDEPKLIEVAGSQRNVTKRVTGRVYPEKDGLDSSFEIVIEPGLKLGSLVWLIQEKLGLYIWLNDKQILLPMESRNSIRLDNPLVISGNLRITPFNLDLAPISHFKTFFLILDFDR